MNKLELGRTKEKLQLQYFENEMRTPLSAKPLMLNPLTRTEGQLLFTRCLLGVALEDLTSCDKLKLGDKGLHVYQMMMQNVSRDNSGLSLARRKNSTFFLRWIMSVIPDPVIQACYQKATKKKRWILESGASF